MAVAVREQQYNFMFCNIKDYCDANSSEKNISRRDLQKKKVLFLVCSNWSTIHDCSSFSFDSSS